MLVFKNISYSNDDSHDDKVLSTENYKMTIFHVIKVVIKK